MSKADQYYIVRSPRAGVFFGNIKEHSGGEVTMTNARRIWYWNGAASLSQLAIEGVKHPEKCKFTVTVPEMTILEVVEIIPCTDAAVANIKGIEEWRV